MDRVGWTDDTEHTYGPCGWLAQWGLRSLALLATLRRALLAAEATW